MTESCRLVTTEQYKEYQLLKEKHKPLSWSELKEKAKEMGWKVEDVYFDNNGEEIHTEAISNGKNISFYELKGIVRGAGIDPYQMLMIMRGLE